MVKLHVQPRGSAGASVNPLPKLLHTPRGLALIELQGTINIPPIDPSSSSSTSIGRLTFPLEGSEEDWTKNVYLYVGQHQRLTGEIKKLPKPMAVVQKRDTGGDEEELEVVEIVEYKILFGARPEPVGEAVDKVMVDDEDG